MERRVDPALQEGAGAAVAAARHARARLVDLTARFTADSPHVAGAKAVLAGIA
jgi:hypothetical protein